MNNRQSDFVTQYRGQITKALEAIGALLALKQEADLVGWPAALEEEKALVGANGDIDLTMFAEAMTAAASILADISNEEMAALYKVRV